VEVDRSVGSVNEGTRGKNTVAEPSHGSYNFVRWSLISTIFFRNLKGVNNITVDVSVDADFRLRSGNIILILILYAYLNFNILHIFLQMDFAGNPFK